MTAVDELRERVGIAPACAALRVPRATYYRSRRPRPSTVATRAASPRAITALQRDRVLEVLNSERFVDRSPVEAYATLLDEGEYLCSMRSMYRILASNGAVRERRDQLRHPAYSKPELLATGPNQVWSWDITKLLGPAKWTYFCLYVILDIFSRLVVGWMIAARESAALASKLIEEAARRHGIRPGQLTLHADRGAAMTSKPVAFLMADLGITKTHSRPHVSDDNPYSESHFKTLKYCPSFPDRFGSIEDARAFCAEFIDWYNHEHRHSGLNLFTPAAVHFQRTDEILRVRQETMDLAYARNPQRFVRGRPIVAGPPTEAWINRPTLDSEKPTAFATPGHVIVNRGDPGLVESALDEMMMAITTEHETTNAACVRGAQ
jgi:putative transposase